MSKEVFCGDCSARYISLRDTNICGVCGSSYVATRPRKVQVNLWDVLRLATNLRSLVDGLPAQDGGYNLIDHALEYCDSTPYDDSDLRGWDYIRTCIPDNDAVLLARDLVFIHEFNSGVSRLKTGDNIGELIEELIARLSMK